MAEARGSARNNAGDEPLRVCVPDPSGAPRLGAADRDAPVKIYDESEIPGLGGSSPSGGMPPCSAAEPARGPPPDHGSRPKRPSGEGLPPGGHGSPVREPGKAPLHMPPGAHFPLQQGTGGYQAEILPWLSSSPPWVWMLDNLQLSSPRAPGNGAVMCVGVCLGVGRAGAGNKAQEISLQGVPCLQLEPLLISSPPCPPSPSLCFYATLVNRSGKPCGVWQCHSRPLWPANGIASASALRALAPIFCTAWRGALHGFVSAPGSSLSPPPSPSITHTHILPLLFPPMPVCLQVMDPNVGLDSLPFAGRSDVCLILSLHSAPLPFRVAPFLIPRYFLEPLRSLWDPLLLISAPASPPFPPSSLGMHAKLQLVQPAQPVSLLSAAMLFPCAAGGYSGFGMLPGGYLHHPPPHYGVFPAASGAPPVPFFPAEQGSPSAVPAFPIQAAPYPVAYHPNLPWAPYALPNHENFRSGGSDLDPSQQDSPGGSRVPEAPGAPPNEAIREVGAESRGPQRTAADGAVGGGIANLHGGLDDRGRRIRDERAAQAYARELDEQVRAKREMAAREADGRWHQGAKRRQRDASHPPAAGAASPTGGAAQSGARDGDAHPRGRRELAELRAGPSEEQRSKAAAQNEELRLEWQRQLEEKRAAAEQRKAEERAREEREEADIRRHRAELAERDREERRRRNAHEPARDHFLQDEQQQEQTRHEEHKANAASVDFPKRQGNQRRRRMYQTAETSEGREESPPRPPAPPLPQAWQRVDALADEAVRPRCHGIPAATECDGEVSVLLRQLKHEQSSLREHMAQQAEAMRALKEQAESAQADRSRAQAELVAVRQRMAGVAIRDALDEFIVETHILPKHINSIPDDLEHLPAVELGIREDGGARTPDLSWGAGIGPGGLSEESHGMNMRARQVESPAIICGGLAPSAQAAPSNAGSKNTSNVPQARRQIKAQPGHKGRPRWK
eukprot:CAMPEP_0177581328 /NCGR_PEP_ID=MMETSP0419_2-20121207/2085_1 /TAXON_ID=582737 /ORGANISM="Tetraselmis sp., Strain GSL018" /LENGTH=961 /DNA_ID=CAMNT_0019070355 /DNA_START=1173 /DNA_END=4061 /DNA_ORIENTATION=+